MSLVEQEYCSQQINVPPRLPMILKRFCKAAIRTQPYDLLKWSGAYFRALANGEDPPAKIRLEYPQSSTTSGLTPGFLRVLLRQFGDYNKMLSVDTLLHRWDCLCLDRKDLNLIMMIGKFRHECQLKKFLAIAAGLLTSSLSETMIMICELFTHEPDGGSAMIPVTLFMEIYGYLAGLRCDGAKRESFDEDLSDFTLSASDERESSASSHVMQESSEFNKAGIEHALSIASQDAEGDVNAEFELAYKNVVGSTVKHDKDVAIEVGKVNSDLDQSFGSKVDYESLNVSKETDEETIVSETLVDAFENLEINVQRDDECSNKSEEQDSSSTEYITEKSISTEDNGDSRRTKDVVKKKRMKIDDTTLLKYYPNIPGIGPRLSAEQVANVAIWMNESARRQEGMVGPRNIRHFQCPLSVKQQISESKTI